MFCFCICLVFGSFFFSMGGSRRGVGDCREEGTRWNGWGEMDSVVV